MALRFLILMLGVFCAATSVVMTKASQLPPELLSSSRLFIASLVLLPIYLRDKKRNPDFSLKRSLKVSALPAGFLALHFITWTIGARLTTSANSTLIVNLIPIAMPFFGYFLLNERLNKKELIGTLLALLGIGVLTVADYRLNADMMTGDIVCLISMLLLAWYLILARKNKWVPTIWLYLVPLYFMAGIICLITGFLRTGFPAVVSSNEWVYMLLLGMVPTVFGHSLLNLAMQWFRSQLVAIAAQLQFLYAGILGLFFFKEVPESSFYLASACMLAGVVWTIVSHTSRQSTECEKQA